MGMVSTTIANRMQIDEVDVASPGDRHLSMALGDRRLQLVREPDAGQGEAGRLLVLLPADSLPLLVEERYPPLRAGLRVVPRVGLHPVPHTAELPSRLGTRLRHSLLRIEVRH